MVKIKEDIQVYTNKKLRILFLALLLVGMFVGNLCAQEAVTAEDTTAIVEEVVVVKKQHKLEVWKPLHEKLLEAV